MGSIIHSFKLFSFLYFLSFCISANAIDLHVMAMEGQPVPGFPENVTFSTVRNPTINMNGLVTFYATLQGGDFHGTEVLILGEPESYSVVAMTGVQAPGAPAGFDFCGFQFLNPATIPIVAGNDSVGFFAKTSSDGQCGSFHPDGLWVYSAQDGIQLVAMDGQQAPGFPPGVVFDGIETQYRYGNSGFLFRADLVDENTATNLGQSYWTGDPNSLSLVALEGDPAPGIPSDEYLDINPGFGAVNNNAETVFLPAL